MVEIYGDGFRIVLGDLGNRTELERKIIENVFEGVQI
jgi:hypothetical protein